MRIFYFVMFIFLPILCEAQEFIMPKDDSKIITEYNDGNFWVYKSAGEYVVGMSVRTVKDDYGKFYRVEFFISNQSASAILLEPEEVYASLKTKQGDVRQLEIYTDEEFQKKMKRNQNWAMALTAMSAGLNSAAAGQSTTYSTSYGTNGSVYTTVNTNYNAQAANQANMIANMQMATLAKSMNEDKNIRMQGYLKKNTIYPKENIVGYMNIKRKKGSVLTIVIPLEKQNFLFDWDVSK